MSWLANHCWVDPELGVILVPPKIALDQPLASMIHPHIFLIKCSKFWKNNYYVSWKSIKNIILFAIMFFWVNNSGKCLIWLLIEMIGSLSEHISQEKPQCHSPNVSKKGFVFFLKRKDALNTRLEQQPQI